MNRLTLLTPQLVGSGVALLLGSGRYLLVAIALAGILWTHSRSVAAERDAAIAEARALRAAHQNLATELAATRLAMRDYESARERRVEAHQTLERALSDVSDDSENTLDARVPASVIRMVRPGVWIAGDPDARAPVQGAVHDDGGGDGSGDAR